MIKYLEALKENEVIKKIIENFNDFLEEEIRHKRKINKKKVYDFYSNTLQKEEWFNNCNLDSLEGSSIFILRSNGGSKRDKSNRLRVVFFELDIKNIECKIRRASFFKRESKTIVAHSMSYENDIENIEISVSSRINRNQYAIIKKNDKVIIEDNVREDMDKCFKNNKGVLANIGRVAQHKPEDIFDYLLLGKTLNSDFLELAILEHDVKLKPEDSIFKIKLNDKKEESLNMVLK